MTPEEIKALIKAKIEGQGTAIDAASVLPSILNEIIDLASQSGESSIPELVWDSEAGVFNMADGSSIEEFAQNALDGKYHAVKVTGENMPWPGDTAFLVGTYLGTYYTPDGDDYTALFGLAEPCPGAGCELTVSSDLSVSIGW